MLQDYLEGGWLPMWKNIVGEGRYVPRLPLGALNSGSLCRDKHHGAMLYGSISGSCGALNKGYGVGWDACGFHGC